MSAPAVSATSSYGRRWTPTLTRRRGQYTASRRWISTSAYRLAARTGPSSPAAARRRRRGWPTLRSLAKATTPDRLGSRRLAVSHSTSTPNDRPRPSTGNLRQAAVAAGIVTAHGRAPRRRARTRRTRARRAQHRRGESLRRSAGDAEHRSREERATQRATAGRGSSHGSSHQAGNRPRSRHERHRRELYSRPRVRAAWQLMRRLQHQRQRRQRHTLHGLGRPACLLVQSHRCRQLLLQHKGQQRHSGRGLKPSQGARYSQPPRGHGHSRAARTRCPGRY
jgi:hypothetical protein